MRKLLPSFGKSKSAEVERAAGIARGQYGRVYTPRSRGAASRDIEKAVASTFECNTWVFRCAQAIATNQARLTMVVRDGDPNNGPEIEQHWLPPLLNQRPAVEGMPSMGSSTLLRTALSMQLLLSSRGAFVEMVRSRSGDVLAFNLLPPHHTKVIPDSETFIGGYEVTAGNVKYTVPAENILWFRNPHPLDPYRSFTPIEAAAIAIDTDYLARLYNATFMRNDGRPGGIITIKGNLLPDDADEIKSYFAGGAGRAGEWRVIEADGMDARDMAATPRDAQYVEGRALSKDETLIAFGVPETVLGNASGRTFSNADAEREVFWMETMPPHLDALAGTWDQADGDLSSFVGFDLSGVDALQRAEITRRQELRDEFDRGLITQDEYREATGRDLKNTALSQALWMPAGMVPTSSNEPLPVLNVVEPARELEVAALDAAPFRKSGRAVG